jgi:hypothetical protein
VYSWDATKEDTQATVSEVSSDVAGKNKAIYIGAGIGGLAFLALIALILIILFKRKRTEVIGAAETAGVTSANVDAPESGNSATVDEDSNGFEIPMGDGDA